MAGHQVDLIYGWSAYPTPTNPPKKSGRINNSFPLTRLYSNKALFLGGVP